MYEGHAWYDEMLMLYERKPSGQMNAMKNSKISLARFLSLMLFVRGPVCWGYLLVICTSLMYDYSIRNIALAPVFNSSYACPIPLCSNSQVRRTHNAHR